MVRGRIVPCKHDEEENLLGRFHTNIIIDTRMYEVKFPSGNNSELTANATAESMYAQHDVNRNEYLLLNALIHHQRYEIEISPMDQEWYKWQVSTEKVN